VEIFECSSRIYAAVCGACFVVCFYKTAPLTKCKPREIPRRFSLKVRGCGRIFLLNRRPPSGTEVCCLFSFDQSPLHKGIYSASNKARVMLSSKRMLSCDNIGVMLKQFVTVTICYLL
jgi:hypothetical protein